MAAASLADSRFDTERKPTMKERERVAWTVLLICFGVFIALLIGIPVGTYQWVERAAIDPTLILQTLGGTVQVEAPDETARLLLAEQGPLIIQSGTTIFNDRGAETMLAIKSPDDQTLLATVQIYPDTRLELSTARSPRYKWSGMEHRLEVTVITGRIRLSMARETDRPVDIRCHTPHGQFLLWEAGSYAFEVSNEESQITVREGKATIVTSGGQLGLGQGQRGMVGRDGLIAGPLRPERNLVVNGNFRQPLDGKWQVHTDAADSSQPVGEVEVISTGGREAVRMWRNGTGHAQTGIYQLINESLRDYQTLQLHVSARLDYQSLGICGALGSECPLMVRIDYQDAAGSPQQWLQGFYYWVDPAVATNPTLCETCPAPRQDHEQHPGRVEFFYDSPNLIELLTQNGNPPASVISISVYASGHSYDVQVSEIELLVGE
jgi:hypothetical protein